MECTRARAAVHLRISRFARRSTEKRETARSLHLGEHLFYRTDNLSNDLQGTKMAAVSGQRLANLTKETLTKIRTDRSFDHFYACLANQRFQENDTLRPDWRLVLVHQAIPKLLKITFDGPIMRLLILSSGLSISALIRKASAFKPRWRPSCLKLL